MKTRIIVDSTVDLPDRCRRQVAIVPMAVRFGSEEYRDGVTIDRRRFYERLVESDELPTTSQATPGDFEPFFREAAQAGESAPSGPRLAMCSSGLRISTSASALMSPAVTSHSPAASI